MPLCGITALSLTVVRSSWLTKLGGAHVLPHGVAATSLVWESTGILGLLVMVPVVVVGEPLLQLSLSESKLSESLSLFDNAHAKHMQPFLCMVSVGRRAGSW